AHQRGARCRRRRPRPGHALEARTRDGELRLAAHHDTVARGIERAHVEPLARGHAEPAALAHGEAVHAAVPPAHAALAVHDLARSGRGPRPDPLDDPGAVAVRA